MHAKTKTSKTPLESESHQMEHKSDLGFTGCDIIAEKPSLHAFLPLHHQTQNA